MERDPIKVIFDCHAPSTDCWFATFGDYDLDAPYGRGSTPEEAIEMLKWSVGEDDE